MKAADFLPPVAVRAARSTAKALAGFVSDFIRGRDFDDAGAGKRETLWQPYAQSAWINAAVNHVAGEIAGRPLKFYDGENEFEDRMIAAWWAEPALGPATVGGKDSRLTREQALNDLAAWERLEGEFFICLSDEWLITAGRSPARAAVLAPFLIANPQRMQAIVQGGELAGWRYSDAAGRQVIFVPEQVIHHKNFNPYDDWRGIGSLQSARIAAEGAFSTGVYIRDLARNNGDQGMVVIAKTGVVGDPQREQVLADLRAKRAALARGQAKDLLISGDITIDRPKEQAASGELLASKALSHQEIFVAFGVPPSMAEVKAAYSIGKDSDYYQLITRTCQPVGGKIAGKLAKVASLQTGRALTAELDWDDHPVMIEVRNGRLEAALKLWGVGMPMQEANDYLGLGMKPFRGWNVGYLPFSVAPVDTIEATPAAEPTEDPALAEPKRRDASIEAIRLLVLARQRSKQRTCVNVTPKAANDPFAAFVCECNGDASVAMKERSEREIAQWRTLISKRRETVASFKGAFGRVLMAARTETLRKVEASGKTIGQKAAVADLLFDLSKFANAFSGTMRDRQKSALNTAGKQLFAEVGKDDPFTYPAEEVLNYLAGRENKLRDVPSAIHEEIKAALEEGINAGETTAQLADRVRAAFNGVSNERALRIAMTETAAAYGAGRDEAMKQAGVQWKKWLTSGNANVRAAHADANGQIVPIDEPFEVDGEQLMFPGDDAGSPGNVINCHCVSVATAEGP